MYWRDSSAIKSTCYSSSGPRFNSQYPNKDSQLLVTPVPGTNALPPPVSTGIAFIWCTAIHIDQTPSYIKYSCNSPVTTRDKSIPCSIRKYVYHISFTRKWRTWKWIITQWSESLKYTGTFKTIATVFFFLYAESRFTFTSSYFMLLKYINCSHHK